MTNTPNPKENCFSGACPTPGERNMNTIKLSEGSGGREMDLLIGHIRERLPKVTTWENITADGATFAFGGKHLVFTSDSYVVTPIFFPGGNIGKIAFCGTVNDLAVMGATPIGISLSLILEEGFSKEEFYQIIDTIATLSRETGIPVVTGDTKVVEKRGLDKIIINTSGIGIAERVCSEKLVPGDVVIVSGGIGEHGTALLAKRFSLEVTIETDSKPLHEELRAVGKYVKQAKDITRGGLSAILNEVATKNSVGMEIQEEEVPLHPQVRALTEILGIDAYSLACEGRFACVVSAENAESVLATLRTFNTTANKIGVVTGGSRVIVKTLYGKKILSTPSGNIVPRIC